MRQGRTVSQVDSADSDVSLEFTFRVAAAGPPAVTVTPALTGIMPRATGPGCPGPSVR